MPKKVSKRLPAPKPKGQRSSRSTQKNRAQHGDEGKPRAQPPPRALAAQGTPVSSTPGQPRQEGSPDESPQQSTTSGYAIIRRIVRTLSEVEHATQYFPNTPKSTNPRIQAAAMDLMAHLHEVAYKWLSARWPPECEACNDGTCDAVEHLGPKDLEELFAMSEPDPRAAAIAEYARKHGPKSEDDRRAREAERQKRWEAEDAERERPFVEDLENTVARLPPNERGYLDTVTRDSRLDLYAKLKLAHALDDTGNVAPEKRIQAVIALADDSGDSYGAVLQLAGAGMVEGIEGLRRVIQRLGGKVGASERAVQKFAVRAGIMKPGENAKKAERIWDLAEIEPKVIAEVKRRSRRRSDQGPS